MRAILALVAVPAVLAAAAGVAALLAPAPEAAAAPPESVGGFYSGKAVFKFSPLVEENAASRGNDLADATINVDGSNVMVNLTVHADGGDQLYTLMGSYGLGRLHASGGGPGGQTTLVGKATGVEGKVKLTLAGYTLAADSINELKLVLKEFTPVGLDAK